MLFGNLSSLLPIIPILLISGVIFVNGFTDAPNSVSGVVSSGIWKSGKACAVSGIFNMLGVVIFTLLSGKVAEGVVDLSDFGEYGTPAVYACLTGVILFGISAWAFAMPSSESHALLSCIFGASLASSSFPTLYPFLLIIAYMLFSCVFSLVLALVFSYKLKKTPTECIKYEKITCMLSSFAHGAQDGQKLIALCLVLLPMGISFRSYVAVLLSLPVGIIMMAGTFAGGSKIISSLGNGIVENDSKIAFLSDFSTTVCVFLCSLLGFSVSTGNIKACSLIGAGIGCGKKINYKTVKKIVITSALTFPICIALGFILTKLFIRIF